jgi:hypothetical protein
VSHHTPNSTSTTSVYSWPSLWSTTTRGLCRPTPTCHTLRNSVTSNSSADRDMWNSISCTIEGQNSVSKRKYDVFILLFSFCLNLIASSQGRVESIFCSLPAEARWRYDYQPPSGSREEFVVRRYLRPQNWVSLQSEDDLEESEVDVTPDPTSL